jgi:hypothetical protein
MTPDPSILENLPAEILAAARQLESYFRQQGVEDWTLCGVCSRSMYERLKNAPDRLAPGSLWSQGNK